MTFTSLVIAVGHFETDALTAQGVAGYLTLLRNRCIICSVTCIRTEREREECVFVHACVRARARAHVCVCVCVRARARACVRAFACSCVCVCE